MVGPEWEKLKEIFHTAVTLQPKDRPAYLDQACAGDALLRQSVESLLKSHEECGFVDEPAYAAAANLLIDDEHRAQLEVGAFQPGDTIGRYRINSLLGEGGMGRVYLAEDTKLHRKVSLKFLSKAVTSDHEKLLRFEQEARAASALNQPNILTIYEFGEEDGQQFIATEYVEGQTLRERLQRPIELDDALEISIQTASALVAAHRVNIVHRDIKPDNIIIRKDDGLVKVLDFGLAKIVAPRTPEAMSVNGEAPTRFKTGPGVVMGTVAYMSPEQARGDKVDERTDIWSLGVVLYEMIAGSTPFVAETSNEIISGILSKKPAPPLTRFSHDVPERLQEIVEKTLTKDRGERYQTSKDLLIDLKRLKQSLELKASLDRSSPADTARASSRSEETASVQVAVPTTYPTSSAEYVVNQIKHHKRGLIAAAATLLVVIVGSIITGISLYRSRQASITSAPPISSLAVLPLVNGNADPDIEFLSDGITDNIIERLSRLPGLQVMSHTAVFRYKGRDADARAIANDLGVEAILTGRLIKHNDTLTINLELVNARDNSHIWGEQYDRKLSDVQLVQREIPVDIAEKLRLRLSGDSKERLVRGYTDNADAYQLYLKGVFYWNKRKADGYKKAVEFFNQSIEKDPNYALAYAGLAGCYAQGDYPLPPKERMPLARQSALKAIELDETLAEPHISLGRIRLVYDWDRESAEKELKLAIELNPNSSLAHMRYAEFFTLHGNHEEAIAESKKAVALDPVSPVINWSLEFTLFNARRYDEAIEQARKTLEIDSSYVRSYYTIGTSYELKEMYEQAFEWYLKAANLDGRTSEVMAWKEAYATGGVQSYYRKRLDLEMANGERDLSRQSLISVAVLYARLGEKEKSLEWLQRAFEERPYGIMFLKMEPAFDNMRSDPRFVELMKRIGLGP